MNYQIISNSYINAGGGIMVHVSEVWLPDENRTVWCNVGEGSITLTTVDHICQYVEDIDYRNITIDAIDFTSAADDCKYIELFRECLTNFVSCNGSWTVHRDLLPPAFEAKLRTAISYYNLDDDFESLEFNGSVLRVVDISGREVFLTADDITYTTNETLTEAIEVLNDCLRTFSDQIDADYAERILRLQVNLQLQLMK